MPVLYLTEDDVRRLLTMDLALEAVEAGLKKLALDEAVKIPQARCQTDHSMLHIMAAAGKTLGAMGFKAYVTNRRGAHFHFHLFDGKTGEHQAWMQADYLGQMRTGAASGVATKYMARPDCATVGVFGSGKQARTQLQAVCKVRPVKHVKVFSRTPAHALAVAAHMVRAWCVDVAPV